MAEKIYYLGAEPRVIYRITLINLLILFYYIQSPDPEENSKRPNLKLDVNGKGKRKTEIVELSSSKVVEW